MTGTRSREAFVAERMRLVLALGEAHAAHHRAQARAAGAQIEAMHAARVGGPSDDEAQAAETAARSDLAAAETKVSDLEDQLAALDREFAAAAP